MLEILKSIFGSKAEKDIKRIEPYVDKIKIEYEKLCKLSNDELRQKTQELKNFYKENTKNEDDEYNKAKDALIKNTSIDKIGIIEMQLKIKNSKKNLEKKSSDVLMEMLPTAFAIVKDTARRFTENESLEVKTSDFDRFIYEEGRDYIDINGEKTIWKTSWDVMKTTIKWNMIHFDEQLIGGIILHDGKIAEMATGEGKTLVSTLPIFLNALSGRGVHVVTVNDYLSKRDFAWNRPIFEFHGLSVGCIDETSPGSENRRKAYNADITYGTNNEFGFDYLRDNMSESIDDCVQREHNYAIVDEVDSVLIDDARTPLIISGHSDNDDVKDYERIQPVVKHLYEEQVRIVNRFLIEAKKGIESNDKSEKVGLALLRAYRGFPKYSPLIKFLSEPGVKEFKTKVENIYLEDNSRRMPEVDKELLFHVEEKYRNVELTDKGFDFLSGEMGDEKFFLLPDISINIEEIEKDTTIDEDERIIRKDVLFKEYSLKASRIHIVQQLLKSYTLFAKDVDYVVFNGRVLIVDEQTGRILEGRRYSDGLHQALEAKELVKIEKPSQTYATVTLQNYFRLYHKLSGMTGTAETESVEFLDIYKLDVVKVPTHKKIIRQDKNDLVYKTIKAKFAAIVEEIVKLSGEGRPVLVGTTSVETSEMLSKMLVLRKINHQVLNAKYHEKEAEIVARAGISGTVTIATNMAGRGTDIKLDKDALKLGGLAIIGTERHESRRVDRQLRGRAGRQGDPGSSQFYVSFEDNLMRMTLGDAKAQMFIDSLADNEVIESKIVTRSIERAQKKVEENNFGYRRRLLEYDDVLNKQREKIYSRRRAALKNEIINSDIYDILWHVVKNYVLCENEDVVYDDVCRRYKDLTGVVYEQKKEDFEDDVYSCLLDSIYKDFVEKYKRKCVDIDKKIFGDKEVKSVIHGISVSDEKYRLNIEADFISNKFENEVERGEYLMRMIVSKVSILFIDKFWQKHLQIIDDLKQAVQNSYYEQTDPLVVFKFECFDIFMNLLTSINCEIMKFIFRSDVDKTDGDYWNDTLEVDVEDDIKKDVLKHMKKKLNAVMNG